MDFNRQQRNVLNNAYYHIHGSSNQVYQFAGKAGTGKTEVLKEITSLPQSSLELAESLEQLRWLENGYTIKAGITEVETIGIDTPQDLEKAEEFLKIC